MDSQTELINDMLQRMKELEVREKEIGILIDGNAILLLKHDADINEQLTAVKNDIRDIKKRITILSRNLKIIAKEFRLVAKSEDLNRVMRNAEAIMNSNLISKEQAERIVKESKK